MIELSIILPCYNEGGNLPDLVKRYQQTLAGRKDIEVVCVDNGSTDSSSEILSALLQKPENSCFSLCRVPVNVGYGHGILEGLKVAQGRFLAWSHADQQCPPEDVLRLFAKVQETGNPEKCFGKGRRTNRHGSAAFISCSQAQVARALLGHPMSEINAQPKLFHRSLLSEFKRPPTGFELDIYALDKAYQMGLKIVEIDVLFLDRKHGTSKWAYSLASRIRLILKTFWYMVVLRFRRGQA